MNTGQIISGLSHVGLIGWVMLAGVFRSEPPAVEVTEVSVISSAAFEALIAAEPQPVPTVDVALPTPAPETPSPETPSIDQAPQAVQPEVTPAPEAEALPDTPAPLPPRPEAPEPLDQATLVPAPIEEPVATAPAPAIRPRARPVERIAPQPVAQPSPESRPDIVSEPDVLPDETEAPVAEENDGASPPEAATATAAEPAPNAPLTSSPRPPSRPQRTAAAPEADSIADDVSAAVADAVSEALAAVQPPAAPAGPPLSAGERDALRLAIAQCWNVGSLSSEALETTVTVAMAMNRNGTPVTNSIRMAGFSGGTEAGARQAFEAARRAIIRCGSRGFDLPDEKFEQWKDVEITFNPERMRF